MGIALKCVNKSTVYLPKNKYSDFHVFGGSVSVRIKRRRAATWNFSQIISETHKGLKRVTRAQCSWIFTFTIFGSLSDGYPFSTKWLQRYHHAEVLRQELCISRLKIHRPNTKNGKRKFKRMLSFLFVEKGKLFIKKSSFEEFNLVFFTSEHMVC